MARLNLKNKSNLIERGNPKIIHPFKSNHSTR